MLPCLHSGCRSCLVEKSLDGQVMCPTCYSQVSVSMLNKLPMDHLRLDRDELEKIKNREVYCSVCAHQSEIASHHCKECDHYLCEIHNIAHSRAQLTQDHRSQPIELYIQDYHGFVPHITNKVPCSNCRACDIRPDFYCEGCQEFLCLNCKPEHSKNKKKCSKKALPIPEYYSRIHRLIDSSITEATQSVNCLTHQLDKLDDLSSSVIDVEQKMNEQINMSFDRMIGVLNERRKALLNKGQEAIAEKLSKISSERHMVESVIVRYMQSVEFANDLMNSGNQCGLIQTVDLIYDKLDSINDVQYTVKETPFHMRFECNDCAFSKAVNNYGKISLWIEEELSVIKDTNEKDDEEDIKEAYEQRILDLNNKMKEIETSQKETENSLRESLASMTQEYEALRKKRLQELQEGYSKKEVDIALLIKKLDEISQRMQKGKKKSYKSDDVVAKLKELIEAIPCSPSVTNNKRKQFIVRSEVGGREC